MTQISLEEALSTIRAAGALALAEALVVGFDSCDQNSGSLTQLQKIDLAQSAIMSYNTLLDAGATLKTLAEDPVLGPLIRGRE